MIESVSTFSVQGSNLRHASQVTSVLYAAQETSTSANLPSWRIRVDNSLDRAIIEVRSSESGKVIRQYPTEAQLRAFARAQELESARKAAQSAQLLAQTLDSGSSSTAKSTPAPEPVQAPAANTQQASAVSAALASSGTPKSTTQSVVV